MSLRTILLVLALVPTLALVALWAMNSAQLYSDWKSVNDRNNEAKQFGPAIVTVLHQLQAERRLSAVILADPGTDGSALARQRKLTDRSVQDFGAFSDSASGGLGKGFRRVSQGLERLPAYRAGVDKQNATQKQTFEGYSGVIALDIQLIEEYAKVGIPEVTVLTKPVLDAQWGLEMLAREDAIIAAGTASGQLASAQRFQLAEVTGSEQHIFDDSVVPRLSSEYAQMYRRVLSGAAWKQKTAIERTVLGSEDAGSAGQDGSIPVSAQLGKDWQRSYGAITLPLNQAAERYSEYLTSTAEDKLNGMMTKLVVNTAVGAVAVLLVFLISLRLTRVLRRRILGLRSAALELRTRLPEIVDRLRQGETVDTDAELPEILYGDDELGMLGKALNEARGSALETAVRQVEQHRGFERLLQRIARRTQLLIGMQMKRLGEMQRRHEDPEVLEGLFDVDHLAARLRRYEENLVILGGGQPQR
ncbi:nitrate- and nitrite sensing domain-containing protein, partial [Streptomyces sp. NPDC002920]